MPQQGENKWTPAVIVRHHEALRSYMVQVENQQLRRNRKHLRSSTHTANETIDDQPDDGKLHVESPLKESSQEPTSLTQATTNKIENSDATQQASTRLLRSQTPLDQGDVWFYPKSYICGVNVKGQFN